MFFYSKFVRELEECGLDPVKLAQVFVRNNSGFSVYTHYCTNYPRYFIFLIDNSLCVCMST